MLRNITFFSSNGIIWLNIFDQISADNSVIAEYIDPTLGVNLLHLCNLAFQISSKDCFRWKHWLKISKQMHQIADTRECPNISTICSELTYGLCPTVEKRDQGREDNKFLSKEKKNWRKTSENFHISHKNGNIFFSTWNEKDISPFRMGRCINTPMKNS